MVRVNRKNAEVKRNMVFIHFLWVSQGLLASIIVPSFHTVLILSDQLSKLSSSKRHFVMTNSIFEDNS